MADQSDQSDPDYGRQVMPYVRVPVYVDPDKRLTKLDLISYTYAEELRKIPCRNPSDPSLPMTCNTCGHEMPNEFEFAAHYTVDDTRYPNLGHCPSRDA